MAETDGVVQITDLAHSQPSLVPRTDLKFIGQKEYAFANAALLKALGDPWISADPIRKFGPFEVEIVTPASFQDFKHSVSKTVVWTPKTNGGFVLKVKPESPKNLSVIVPVYNPDLSELEACIGSILKALEFSNASGFEVVLINDGSNKNTPAIEPLIQNLRKMNSLSEDQLHLKSNPANRGVCFSRNRGFRESTKDFVYFVDADDMVHPWYFTLLHAELSAGADFASTSMIQAGGEICCAGDRPLNEILLKNSNGSGIGVRRSFFAKLSSRADLYNADNAFHYEDWELNIFARLAGAKISIVDAPLYYYRNDQFGRNVLNDGFLPYSHVTTPYNALKAAHTANLAYPGRELFDYTEKLIDELLSMRHFQVPNKPISRKILLVRAFLMIDLAISNKMYLCRTLKFLRRLWTRKRPS